MGPFPVARPRVYAALDKLMKSKSKLPFSSLIEAAIISAKTQLPQPQPWEAIRQVTQNQLLKLKAQAALDSDGKPLPDRWDSGRRLVHRLADHWQLRAIGEILMVLFESDNVTGHDIVNVCRSVWGSSSSEALAELYRVMEYLTDVARVVEEDKSGVFRVKRHQVQDAAPSHIAPRTERIAPVTDQGIALDESKDIVH